MESAERLYKTVLELQGPRNILVDSKKHTNAGNHIIDEFCKAGLQVDVQEFKLEGCDYTFRNIEGFIGDVRKTPQIVILAHYDSVETTYGANDNAAGVALLTETGRQLVSSGYAGAVSLVAVDLEETRSNPVVFGKELEILKEMGIKDRRNRYKSWRYKTLIRGIEKETSVKYSKGQDQGSSYREAVEVRRGILSEDEYNGLIEISHLYDGINLRSSIGSRSRIGSSKWLEKALEEGRSIKYAIAVDEPGIYYNSPMTQRPVNGFDFSDFKKGYLLDKKNRVGNFAAVMSVENSAEIATNLLLQFESEEIQMPYAWGHLPFGFEGVCKYVPDGLGSDHAAFLREEIPAIFIFDSSMGRDPYVHTWGDTIDVIDFDSLAKIPMAITEMITGGQNG